MGGGVGGVWAGVGSVSCLSFGACGAGGDGFRLWLYPSYGGWVRVGGGVCVAMWKRIAVYGLLLGLGTLALQWLDYQRMARLHMRGVYDFLLEIGRAHV